jgi:nitrous oxidase accessory protein NosD
MNKFLYTLILSLIINYNSYSQKEIFVNNIIGKDTIGANYGSTPNFPLKTINFAIGRAEYGDLIIVEGLHNKESIIYKENIILTEDKPFLRFKGVNNPIILGSETRSNNNTGILVLNSDIQISGFTFMNFIGGNIEYLKMKGGAGIVLKPKNRDAIIQNCTFKNCNYGIIAIENQSLRIDGNYFKDIKKLSNNNLDGGIGIYLRSNGGYLQDNQIGSSFANTFEKIDNYGILIGGEGELKLADFTKIENNSFLNSEGTGLGIFNVEGILNITNNTFENNNVSLEIRGVSIDAVISNNKFNGTKGNYEIITDENYPGDMLYSIWKFNDNKFKNQLYSISEPEDVQSIKSINGQRALVNDLKTIKKYVTDGVNILK